MKDETRKWFEKLLVCALTDRTPEELPEEAQWPEVSGALHRHKVAALVCGALAKAGAPDHVLAPMETAAREAARQSYHLLFTTKYLIARLEEAGIGAAVMKGSSTARYYPVPELRKSGDVDLLLTDPGQMEAAGALFRELGMELKPEQHATHHQEWVTPEGIDVELHTRLIELVNREEADRCIGRQGAQIPLPLPRENLMGVTLPVLPQAYEAYHLLLHMVQHFLGAGFGVRLLCDWVLFWNRPVSKADTGAFLELVREVGLTDFMQMVTSVCVHRLGLRGCAEGLRVDGGSVLCPGGECFCELLSEEACGRFLDDVYAGGDFGGGDQGRMIMVSGHGLGAYVREFHHQMRRNYPRASKCNLIWPVLWVLTFVTFLRNNRRLNRGSVWQILRKTRQRSGMLEKDVKLFH